MCIYMCIYMYNSLASTTFVWRVSVPPGAFFSKKEKISFLRLEYLNRSRIEN